MMKKIALLFCLLSLAAASADAQSSRAGRVVGVLAVPAEDPADSLYRASRTSISEGDYRKAAALLKELVDKFPKSDKAGDALYWRAWSLHKLGVERRSKADLDEALTAIDKQQKDYASAVTAADGRTLRTQIRSAQASLGDARAASDVAAESKQISQSRGCSGSRADEETRLAALDGLVSMNTEDAVPILKEVLKQRDPCRIEMRKRAVFLLATKRAPDVTATLLDVARNDPSSEVRGEAVQWMTHSGSEAAVPLLDSVLVSSRDEEVQKRAIFALSQVAGRNPQARQSLMRAVENEKLDDEVRADAIYWLGQGKLIDLDYFKTLFKKTTSREVRDRIVFAVSQTQTAAAATWLQEMARDNAVDVETRKNAIFHLSQRQLIDLDALASIYDQSRGNSEIQEQIIFVYSTRREPAAVDKLIAIAKNDPSVEHRKSALFWLGKKDDPRAKAFIRDLLKS